MEDRELATVLPEVDAAVKLGTVTRVPEETDLAAGLGLAHGGRGREEVQGDDKLDHHRHRLRKVEFFPQSLKPPKSSCCLSADLRQTVSGHSLFGLLKPTRERIFNSQ